MLDELAEERSWQRREQATLIYSLEGGFPRLYFYPSNGLIEFRVRRYAQVTSSEDGAELLRRIEEFEGRSLPGKWPALSEPERVLTNWQRIRDEVLVP